MPKIKVEPPITRLELHYLHEEGMSRYRVWNAHWFHDQFEVVLPEEFETLKAVCAKYSIPLNEQAD
jgi:hypothetical protein